MISVKGWPLPARLAVTALLGALGAFGLAPWGLWQISLVVLALVPALFLSASSTRQAALIGWAFGGGWFAHGLIWIVEPFLVDVARFGWMAPFAIGLMAAGGGAFWAVAFAGAHRFGRGESGRIMALILTWSLIEFARAYLFTGFPWAALAQIWPDSDAALLLAWFGPHGLALVTLLVTLLPGLAVITSGPALIRLASLVPAAGLAVASLSLAQARPDTVPITDKTIRMVQPNAPQNQKWDPAYMPVFFQRQIGFTSAGERPDLIVWPETAVPTLLNYATPVFETITEAAAGVPVVLGIQRTEEERYYNSLVYLDENGQVAARYDKQHLVPFGEYIPFGDLAAKFGLRGFAAQEGDGFSAGPGPVVLDLGAMGTALPLICYEAVFPQDIARAQERPDYLLQITNDAWFGTASGPYQHLAQARMRAIEQGLPMIRAANTGVSAMIDPWGRITKQLPLGQAGYIDAALPLPLAPTLYARTGDTPVFLLLLAATFGLWGLQSRGKSRI
jgi:apolipoprotein N-acyltransferase